MPDFLTAKDVSEYLLERTGNAMMTGEFDDFMSCIHLPLGMDTPQGVRLMETSQDVNRVFDGMVAYLKSERIAQIARHCIEASFRDAGTIVATHETRLLTVDIILAERPFPAFSILKKIDHVWKIADMKYATENSPRFTDVLMR